MIFSIYLDIFLIINIPACPTWREISDSVEHEDAKLWKHEQKNMHPPIHEHPLKSLMSFKSCFVIASLY